MGGALVQGLGDSVSLVTVTKTLRRDWGPFGGWGELQVLVLWILHGRVVCLS